MKKIKKFIIILIIIAMLFIGKAYATPSIIGNQMEFKVRFSGNAIISNKEKVKASITNETNATINVTGLTMKENIETVSYIVQNTSRDLYADLSVNTTNNNKEYFNVTTALDKNSLSNGEATKITVKIELLKEPINVEEKAVIGIQLKAIPIQPNGNDYSQSIPENNQEYGYYEKDETPKTGF